MNIILNARNINNMPFASLAQTRERERERQSKKEVALSMWRSQWSLSTQMALNQSITFGMAAPRQEHSNSL